MFISNIYEEISLTVREKITEVAKNLGYSVSQIIRYSNHPNDNYLYLVLGKGGYKGGYVTWLFNANDMALFDGHYDMTFKVALLDLAERIIEIQL